MEQFSEAEVNNFISQASNGKNNNLGDFRTALAQNYNLTANEFYTFMVNKINIQKVSQNFSFPMMPFQGVFGEQVMPAGAVAETISMGLPLITDYDGTEVVPTDIEAFQQYAFQYPTIIKKRIKYALSEAIIKGAATSTINFSAFVADYVSRASQAWNLWFWKYVSQDLLLKTKNVINGVTNKKGDYPNKSLYQAFKEIFQHTARMSNPSSEYNIGAEKGATTFTYNNVSYPVKTNNTPIVNLRKSEAHIFINPELKRQYDIEALSNRFHDDYMKLEECFAGVHALPNDYSTSEGLPDAGVPVGKHKILVLDRKAYAMWVRLDVSTTFVGVNLKSYIYSNFWKSMDVVLCNNGFAYDFTKVDDGEGEKVTIVSPLDTGAVSVKEKTLNKEIKINLNDLKEAINLNNLKQPRNGKVKA